MLAPPPPRIEDALRRYGPALARLASAYARNKAEREDLLQDFALALLVALPTFRGDCPERAFVLRVAHNRALALLTRRRANAAVVASSQPPRAHDNEGGVRFRGVAAGGVAALVARCARVSKRTVAPGRCGFDPLRGRCRHAAAGCGARAEKREGAARARRLRRSWLRVNAEARIVG